MADATPKNFSDLKDAYEIYESGKKRRYELLFAVNGGAFAIAKLISPSDQTLGGLSLSELAIGMAIFTLLMVWDIYAFGEKMRDSHLPGEVFGLQGKAVLHLLGLLIISGWLLVALDPKFKSILIAICIIVAIALLITDFGFLPWKRKVRRSTG